MRTLCTRWLAVVVLAVFACSNQEIPNDPSNASGGDSGATGNGDSGATGNGGRTGNGAGGTTEGEKPQTAEGLDDLEDISMVPEPLRGLAGLGPIKARVISDSVSLHLNMIDDAKDYRVYALPNADAVSEQSDGRIAIKDVTYRCAGIRYAAAYDDDDVSVYVSYRDKSGDPINDGSSTENILGYVFSEPGDGRVPVFELGYPRRAWGYYGQAFWNTRGANYTVSVSERDELLAEGYRDDGIAFYVLEGSSAGTHHLTFAHDPYPDEDAPESILFAEGTPEYEQRMREDDSGGKSLFSVLSNQTEGSIPLYRYTIGSAGTMVHDRLAAGRAFYDYGRLGGIQPTPFLTYSGLTEETILVVEALDAGCPYRGILGPKDVTPSGGGYQRWHTPESLRALDSEQELFINGQYNADNLPKAIRRSFIKVSPTEAPTMDFFVDFSPDKPFATPTNVSDCNVPGGDCGWENYTLQNDLFTFDFITVDSEYGDRSGVGVFDGQLWVRFSDAGTLTNGKFRMMAKPRAKLAADNYLHVTMAVNTMSTGRRYPQILISDQGPRMHDNMANGKTVIVQTFNDWPVYAEVQWCERRVWEVNNQCPGINMRRIRNQGAECRDAPHHELGEMQGDDRAVTFDVYASTERVFVFLEGEPYGCTILPSGVAPEGEVTVSWGNVLYHSSADSWGYPPPLHADGDSGEVYETLRKYDQVGFNNDVAAPAWDFNRFPCQSVSDHNACSGD